MVTPGNMSFCFFGLSTDKKPTGNYNGSQFIEMDTGKLYIWDAEHSIWINMMGTTDEEES